MKIENKNCNNLAFNAYLKLRGNVSGLTSQQKECIRKIASQIGTSKFDKIDIFAHFPREKSYTMIDISGCIKNRIKATNVSYIGQDVYSGIINALKFMITKIYNNEIIEQFTKCSDKSQYKNLENFIINNGIELKKTENKKYIKIDKLIIDGYIDNLSEEETESLAKMVNTVSTNPHDKVYAYIRQGTSKEIYLINMAAYINGVLKSALSDYENKEIYKGMRKGIIFIIEKLFRNQIQESAVRNLPSEKIDKINRYLKQEHIDLII